MLTKLKLNDNLIFRDKKYLINEMSSDLTTGEVQLTLLNCWFPTGKKGRVFRLNNSSHTAIEAPITMNENSSVTMDAAPFEASFTTLTTGTSYPYVARAGGDDVIKFNVSANVSGLERTNTWRMLITTDGVEEAQTITIIQEA
jgi:hypothetical protein